MGFFNDILTSDFNPYHQAQKAISGTVDKLSGADAAADAAAAQESAANASIEEQRRQFDAMQTNMSPYMEAGESSLNQQLAISGALGEAAQKEAYNTMQNSSAYTTALGEGEKSILQNASVTGGVRGGNTQGALAEYSPSLLNSMMSDQYNQLGSLTSLGQNSAAGVGNAGIATGQDISNSYTDIGNAQANNALSQYATKKNFYTDLAGLGINLAGLF